MELRLLLAAGTFLWSAAGAQALYCGTSLVREGRSKYAVLQACGQPAYTDSRVDYRPVSGSYGPYPQNGYYPQPVILPVEVDEWVYNFGPTQLMPSLLFENGRLVKIRLLGYGN
jgi:hypothetical protein